MKTLEHTTRYPLVAEIENLSLNNDSSLEWFRDTIRNILESPKETYKKADSIALSISEIESRISYISDEIKAMTAIKKKLTLARTTAQEIVAEIMSEYGVDKIEGVAVSSLSITPEKKTYKEKITVKDERKLMELGYVNFSVDLESIASDIATDVEKLKDLDDYISVDVTETVSSAKVRINKKRASNATQADKLVELAEAA